MNEHAYSHVDWRADGVAHYDAKHVVACSSGDICAWRFTSECLGRTMPPLPFRPIVGMSFFTRQPIWPFRHGFHACRSLLESLWLATGPELAVICMSGELREERMVCCASHIAFHAMADVTSALREFSVVCAEQAIDHVKRLVDIGEEPWQCIGQIPGLLRQRMDQSSDVLMEIATEAWRMIGRRANELHSLALHDEACKQAAFCVGAAASSDPCTSAQGASRYLLGMYSGEENRECRMSLERRLGELVGELLLPTVCLSHEQGLSVD